MLRQQTDLLLSFYLHRWDSVALEVIAIIKQQLSSHPDYSIVTTGHSLGGSLALLAAISLRQNFPDRYEPIFSSQRHRNSLLSKIRTYSYGAPRTGVNTFDCDCILRGFDTFSPCTRIKFFPSMLMKHLGKMHSEVNQLILYYSFFPDKRSNEFF